MMLIRVKKNNKGHEPYHHQTEDISISIKLKNIQHIIAYMSVKTEKIVVQDDGIFPNSPLPALLYKAILDIPRLFPATYVKHLFEQNNWSNSWDSGIFEYHHYHSITHEVLGIYAGSRMDR
jgi:hypothetical protein